MILMIFSRGRRRSALVSKRRRGAALNSYVISERRRVECGSHRVSLCCVRVYYTRSLFWCNTKSKSVKKTAKQEKNKIFFDVFSSSLLKSGKNMGTENADQRTNRRPKDRTDTSLISLSLSLSLFCVVYASIHSSSSRKKRRCRITRQKKARRILPPSRFSSQFALSRWWCCFIRAREDEERKHHPPRKEEKQTNKGRR